MSGRMTKENWIVLVCTGLLLMIVAVPINNKTGNDQKRTESRWEGTENIQEDKEEQEKKGQEEGKASDQTYAYELAMEKRVRQVLAKVEGVGEVDVLIVLKSSEEKVYQTDGKTSQSSTKEQDASGASREIIQQQKEQNTVFLSRENAGPVLEKEIRPEISGIIISAQGGGSPTIQAEITEAMEALFDLPAHKIKVLKRVE